MANRKISVFINKDLLETVAVLFDDYPRLHRLLEHSRVFIDLTEDELDAQLSEYESDLALFQREYDLDFIPSHDLFTEICDNPDTLFTHCREVLFLDKTDHEIDRMRERYGLLVYPQSITTDINPFQKSRYPKELNGGERVGVGMDGWQELLSHVELVPTNSIVINDRHLFDNEFGEVGMNNILAALKALMPKSFQGTFQVSIICRYPRNISDVKCNKIGGDLKAALKSFFNYDISLEVFFISDTLHKRRIYLGYQTIKCDKGFGLFKLPRLDTVREDNEFEFMPAFSLNENEYGDTQFAMDSNDLEKIFRQCKNDGLRYKAKKENGTSDQVQLIGNYDRASYTPSNKLLKF